MVDEDFLAKLHIALGEFEKSTGPVALFAVFKMDELTDKWTVIVSGTWVEQLPFQEMFTDLRQQLLDNLGKEGLNSIARFGIWSTNAHLVELILRKYKTGDYLEDQRINGNQIHEGYILKAESFE